VKNKKGVIYMDKTKGGKDCDLSIDKEILSIRSPRHSVGGPYGVVYKNMADRWVLVALDWEEQPRLGIRWFYERAGHPVSRGYPVWFILPLQLNAVILDGLGIGKSFREILDDFLRDGLSGPELEIIFYLKSLLENLSWPPKDIYYACYVTYKRLKKRDMARRRKTNARKVNATLKEIVRAYNNNLDSSGLIKILDELLRQEPF
jgi:hypothetical protein